ncbi:hypothetical protein [Methylobacterium sp. JK268]
MSHLVPIASAYRLRGCTCGCGILTLQLWSADGRPIAILPLTPDGARALRDGLSEALEGAQDGRGADERPVAGGLH